MIAEKVLFVDDDENILRGYQRQLRKALDVETAMSGTQALELIRGGSQYAVVISDFMMPSMNGIELLREIRKLCPDTVRMILTGQADLEVCMKALNEGHIFRFLTKPCPPDTLANALLAGIGQYRLVRSEKELLEETLNGSVKVLTEILSMVYPDAFGQATRMRTLAQGIAKRLRVKDAWELELGAMLAGVGLVSLPPAIAQKMLDRKPLTEEEQAMADRVSEVSYDLIARIPRLRPVAEIALNQWKGYDGSGKPNNGLKGEDLPQGARVLRVLHDFLEAEARGEPTMAILNRMQNQGHVYDPNVVDALLDMAGMSELGGGGNLERMKVKVDHLREGDLMEANVVMSDGKLLISAGTTIARAHLARLQNYAAMGTVVEPIEIRRAAQAEAAPAAVS